MTHQRERELAFITFLSMPEVFFMQMKLYGPDTQRIAPVSDSAMWGLLRELRASHELEAFRIWLVGSRVEPGHQGSDIDLVLAPRSGFSPVDEIIEHALWYSRDYGLNRSDPACRMDAVFRAGGPSVEVSALPPDTVMKSIKLFSPCLMKDVLSGRVHEYRRLGRFSIAYSRRAADMTYYHKLPLRHFDGLLVRYLRPAIEVL